MEKNFKVIIADDNANCLRFLESIFKNKENFEIIGKAENGEQELSLIKENREVDIVITDIDMPKLSGVEVIEQVKHQKISSCKFFAVTGGQSIEVIKRLNNSGVSAIITKPTTAEKIIKIIEDSIGEDNNSQLVYNKCIIDKINQEPRENKKLFVFFRKLFTK